MEASEEATGRVVTLERAGTLSLTWQVALKPSMRPRRAPVPGQRGYR
jgi:hypothetical protein